MYTMCYLPFGRRYLDNKLVGCKIPFLRHRLFAEMDNAIDCYSMIE